MGTETKKMGVLGLTILVAVNMMGSGIIMLPASLAQTGTISILSWFITAMGSMCIAYAFAKCGRFCKREGGMSAYSQEAHGKSSFFIASYTYYICLVISCVAIAVSAAGYIAPFSPWVKSTPIHTFMTVVAILILTTVANFKGAKITERISSFTVWGIIIPVAGLSVIGWFWFDPKMFMDAWNPQHLSNANAVSSGISLTLWAFLGIESAGANSAAVENPEKNVPLACLFGTAFAAIVYIASTSVIQGIVPNAELMHSDAPFGLVFSMMFNPLVGQIITTLAVIACIGSLLGWQFTNAQVSKSAADSELFPAVFGKVTKDQAPVMGMLIMLALELLLACMTISPNLLNQFNALLNLAVFINMVPYVLSMTGLQVMLRKNKVSDREYRFSSVVSTIGVIYSIYGVYACGSNAVFGGSIIVMFGYIFYGFLAGRDVQERMMSGKM
ncbi:putrescine-ornithine antiporter [Pantoea rodasii]|uniref:Putrescine transporter PotE n=1 Tax=Pantoea rodasii TaxID=1076549 RepID=A0A2M9W5R9_9GAMM|nr:putrescine-ornithine antiporter [Pantoea rodasii]ORM61632.1 putrescine-ornithine antiporter [Pantoea rodasii]PJZ02900.1 putrescine-ornithine antiporter [Pantoea rodasii]